MYGEFSLLEDSKVFRLVLVPRFFAPVVSHETHFPETKNKVSTKNKFKKNKKGVKFFVSLSSTDPSLSTVG